MQLGLKEVFNTKEYKSKSLLKKSYKNKNSRNRLDQSSHPNNQPKEGSLKDLLPQ